MRLLKRDVYKQDEITADMYSKKKFIPEYEKALKSIGLRYRGTKPTRKEIIKYRTG